MELTLTVVVSTISTIRVIELATSTVRVIELAASNPASGKGRVNVSAGLRLWSRMEASGRMSWDDKTLKASTRQNRRQGRECVLVCETR